MGTANSYWEAWGQVFEELDDWLEHATDAEITVALVLVLVFFFWLLGD